MARGSCGTHHGTKQWINAEFCGLFCGSMTWFLLSYGMYATTFGVILPWLGFSIFGFINVILFNGISIMAIYAHIKAMTTDPGAVPKDARPLPSDQEEQDFEANDRDRFKKFCRKCAAFKPARAHHCSICGRCIVKMDHHCPWVNNCIGVGNHKLFLQFVFYVFCSCSYSLVLTSARYLLCTWRDDCGEPTEHLMVIFLVIEAILFGLFTLCMMGDQYTVVATNQTQIDRLKNKKYAYQVEVNEVLGTPSQSPFQWQWLLPVPTVFPPHVKDIIYGFRVDAEENEEHNPLLSTATNNAALNLALHNNNVDSKGSVPSAPTSSDAGINDDKPENSNKEVVMMTSGDKQQQQLLQRTRNKRKGDTGSDDSNYDNDASATAALDEDTSALDFPTGNSGSGAGIELVVSPIDVGGGVGGSTRRKRV